MENNVYNKKLDDDNMLLFRNRLINFIDNKIFPFISTSLVNSSYIFINNEDNKEKIYNIMFEYFHDNFNLSSKKIKKDRYFSSLILEAFFNIFIKKYFSISINLDRTIKDMDNYKINNSEVNNHHLIKKRLTEIEDNIEQAFLTLNSKSFKKDIDKYSLYKNNIYNGTYLFTKLNNKIRLDKKDFLYKLKYKLKYNFKYVNTNVDTNHIEIDLPLTFINLKNNNSIKEEIFDIIEYKINSFLLDLVIDNEELIKFLKINNINYSSIEEVKNNIVYKAQLLSSIDNNIYINNIFSLLFKFHKKEKNFIFNLFKSKNVFNFNFNKELLNSFGLLSSINNIELNFFDIFSKNIKNIEDFYKYDIIIGDILFNIQKEYLNNLNNLKEAASIENIEHFFSNRDYKREIICYFGPTNSGKTHNALKEFKKAKKAIYLAPLRLLAREIFDKYKNELNISLLTGEEILYSKNRENKVTHISSTIEMLDLTEEYDVAIVDEIQLISDNNRGNAWSRALMGVNARKVFVIGSNNSTNIVKKIINKCEDNIQINLLDRLNELKIFKNKNLPINSNRNFLLKYGDIKKGDAIIAFSRNDIHRLKNIFINEGYNVSTVYGSLPPKTRIEQANLFNSGKSDIIIATDAIGMGLNLNIKRIIFTSLTKYNGYTNVPIGLSLFKQISGRAGRYGKYEVGYYGLLDDEDNYYFDLELNINLFKKYSNNIKQKKKDKDIISGYFFPELTHLINFSNNKLLINNSDNLSLLLTRYKEYFYDKDNKFILNNLKDNIDNAIILDNIVVNIDNTKYYLNLKTKYNLMFAPVPYISGYKDLEIFEEFIVSFFISKLSVDVNKLNFIEYYINDISNKVEHNYSLKSLENISKEISLFIWIFYRFYPNKDFNFIYSDIESNKNELDKLNSFKNKLILLNENISLKIHLLLSNNSYY